MTAPAEIEKILFTEEQIQTRIAEVGAEISESYAGRGIKLISVLKGSVFFLTALSRAVSIPVRIDFLGISSFSNSRPGGLRGRGQTGGLVVQVYLQLAGGRGELCGGLSGQPLTLLLPQQRPRARHQQDHHGRQRRQQTP